MSPQETVSFANGCKDFALLTGSASYGESAEQITSRWKDSEGNIWHKTLCAGTTGAYKGYKWQSLQKFSKSGTMWEFVVNMVGEFNSNSYPTKIDPKDSSYRLYYRTGK